MGRKNWLATIVSTTGVNWCWTRLTSRNCCRKSARPAARLRAAAGHKDDEHKKPANKEGQKASRSAERRGAPPKKPGLLPSRGEKTSVVPPSAFERPLRKGPQEPSPP